MSPSYRLFFRDVALMMSIGIHDHERAAPQRYVVSIELLCRGGGAEDDIASVFDYDVARDLAVSIAAERHFNLQETYCRALRDALARTGQFEAIIVAAGKPDIYPDVAMVGCAVSMGDEAALSRLVALRC
jgi:dihydroneopterin aldolase